MPSWLDAIIEGYNRDLPDGCSVRAGVDDDHQFMLEIVVDGTARRGPWVEGEPSDEIIAWMLQEVQGEFIEHTIGEAWPRCRIHGTHPLVPEHDGWHCPDDPESPRWDFGTLAQQQPPPLEPARTDGEVRWFMDTLGWGVIAGEQRDLFVHCSQIEMTGYRTLKEGQRVEYRERQGARQGKFGAVEFCRPLD